MSAIRIDMFEVQLGAAVLLQFAVGEETVRVLADGGVKASGYGADHVHRKVTRILGEGGRLDLVIGTHYDEDHLNGLVPVIDDRGLDIGEAWMPPVINDTHEFALDQPITPDDLLTYQLAREDGPVVLQAYLQAKRDEIETIAALEQDLDPDNLAGTWRTPFAREESFTWEHPLDLSFFRAQLPSGDDQCPIDHGAEQEIAPHPAVEAILAERSHLRYRAWLGYAGMRNVADMAKTVSREEPELAAPRARSLAHLRRSAAKQAINASALHDVLAALRRRSIPVRSEIIEDGVPKRYRWDPARRRFLLARPDSTGLVFDLLGPSQSLVRKHRDRLPVLAASRIALAFSSEIRSITPSNQLSYIGCFRHEGQVMLVTGDAGCVDFQLKRGVYHPALLAALSPLHVIQVAHHGGNAAHFYRVLAKAGYPEQSDPSYLLLSHATHDQHRPSDVFRDFLLTTLADGDDVRLLFTSEPARDKVDDFLGAIHPPVGPQAQVGDVTLTFDEGAWTVKAHAVQVP